MIKYYNTEAEYMADAKSAFESQASLVGADNDVKFDGRNVVVDVKSARTGTVVVLDGTHAMRFIAADTFSPDSFPSNYEIVGVVVIGVDHPDFRGQIAVMNREFPGLAQCVIYSCRLTGYVLDGTDRSGGFSVRQASDNWAANAEYTIAYNATTEAALVEQLNTYFRSHEPFAEQEWQAQLREDGSIDLVYLYKNWSQTSHNAGLGDFKIAGNLAPEWKYNGNMLRRNGHRSGAGSIFNMDRALAYFRSDLTSTSYNPTSDVTSMKIQYPICLPAYLGRSNHQSDHCAYLRSVYGEGEEGWIRFVQSFLPVFPSEYGILDKQVYGDEYSNTYLLASLTYRDINGEIRKMSPAADYVANVGYDHEAFAKGRWVEPGVERLNSIISVIKYPVVNDRKADVINRALLAIGAKPLANSSSVWSCLRNYQGGCWCVYGGTGYISDNDLGNAYLVLPLALIDVPRSALL